MAVRVLVVGAGSIGQRHHANLTALGAESRLRGWRGYGAEGFAAEIGEVDAAVIATATEIRLPLIEAAARAGRPLYIEKPLAASPPEVEAIARATAPVAARSMLGYMMRYHPAFRTLAQRDLSDVFQFSFAIGHDVTQWRPGWRFADSYAAREVGGGVLLDLCHEIDMAACLFPGLSLGAVESHGIRGFPGVDAATRIGLWRAGVPERAREVALAGEVAMDYLTPRLHRRAILRGWRAALDFDFAAGRYQIADGAGAHLLDLPLERNAMFMAIMGDFLALVQGRPVLGVEHMPRLDLALPSARLVAEARAARRFIGDIGKEIQ